MNEKRALLISYRWYKRSSAALLAVLLSLAAAVSAWGEDQAKTPHFLLSWGQRGAEPGEFDFPIGIVASSNAEIFVTDFYNARVQRFSSAGKFLAAFTVSHFPGGIAIDDDGNLYVAHAGIPPSKFDGPRKRDKIAVFNVDGKLLREWGSFGTDDGQFDMPGGIAISHDGRVYVADQCNRRIQVFDKQGKFLAKWGSKGFERGEFGGNPHPKAFFAGPTFLACDKQGNVFTTEATLGRVQKFSAVGESLSAWGSNEVGPGKFGGYFSAFGKEVLQGPTGMCFDANGQLWINSIGGRIQQFSASGEYGTGFGEEGAKPEQFYAPHGLAIDRQGCLYVVDSYNHRIQKFAAGSQPADR